MKRRFLPALIFCTLCTVLFGANIEKQLQTLLDDLARQYSSSADEIFSKKTVSIIGIRNLSEKAEKSFVGEGTAEILKNLIADSLIFKYVDRNVLEAALEEIELALTDISEESEVRVGRIETVDLLLTGSVIEEGDSFLIQVQLVDVETTSVAAAAKTRLPQADLIEESSRIAYEYIVANGVGLGATVSFFPFTVYPQDPTVAVGQDEDKSVGAGSAVISYRLSRRWKFSVDLDVKMHPLHYDNRTYGELENFDDPSIPAAVANTSDLWTSDGVLLQQAEFPTTDISGMSVAYHLEQLVFSAALMSYAVLPITRRFNVSAGLGPAYHRIRYYQNYDQMAVSAPGDGDAPAVKFNRKSIEMSFHGIGAKARVESEYFILPRFSLNLGISYSYAYTFPQRDVDAFDRTTGVFFYGRDDRAIDAFGLDPFRLPDGSELTNGLFSGSYFRIFLGTSLYL